MYDGDDADGLSSLLRLGVVDVNVNVDVNDDDEYVPRRYYYHVILGIMCYIWYIQLKDATIDKLSNCPSIT